MWTLVAAAIVVVALGVGGAQTGTARFRMADTAGAFRPPASVGTPDAIMRLETDRIEVTVSAATQWASRLLLLFAAPLSGLALLLLLTPPRLTRSRGGPPSLVRVRRWVGLRAPPAPLLVAPTP
jgi:hypothetical protein